MGNEIKFKPATFYLGVADHLAKFVEGLESEDVDTGGGKDKRSGERGRGEILDGKSQGVTQVGTNQAPVSEEGVTTEVHPTKGEGAGMTLSSNHFDRVTDAVSLSATVEVVTSTSSTHKPESHTYPPEQHTQESKPQDPSPIPARQTTKPHDEER
jgi:hypothetical protein